MCSIRDINSTKNKKKIKNMKNQRKNKISVNKCDNQTHYDPKNSITASNNIKLTQLNVEGLTRGRYCK